MKAHNSEPQRQLGVCPDCGKVRYSSRKVANRAAREQSKRGIDAYRCGEFWHLGHLPKAVRRGQIGRDYRRSDA